MAPIERKLIEKEIINEERIREIRKWIETQTHYQTADAKEKAAIFARKIHSLIDESLPDMPKEVKNSLRIELIKKNLSGRSLIISVNDVFQACIKNNLIQERKKEIAFWLKDALQTGSGEEEHEIEHFLNKVINGEKDSEETGNLGLEAYNNSFHPETYEESNIHTTDRPIQRKRLKGKFFLINVAAAFSIGVVAVLGFGLPDFFEKDTKTEVEQVAKAAEMDEKMPNDLPSYLQYTDINEDKLRKFLKKRNSLLADDPYFSAIVEAAGEFNVHPLLLFAITGQEQGFVPRDHEKAKKIANNPFNVYHSWKEFNTNIQESSEIAARTVVNLSKGRSEDADPFQWINRKYAEDPKWWKGVKQIFEKLKEEVE